MKGNKMMAGALSLALAVPMLTAAASAAGSENVQATMSGSINVTYEGREQAFTDVNGGSVLPIVYQGTTYLPIRAVAGLAGLGVGWDQSANTVQLTTGGDQNTYDGDFNAPDSAVEVIISQDTAVTLDGVQQSFTDAAGTAVYPLVYNGTTYLPVRAVCGLVGVAVDWDQATSTVKLGEESGTPGEIPEGAKVFHTMDDLYGSLGMEVVDGVYHLNPRLVSYGGGGFTIDTSGYSKVVFTLKTGEFNTRVTSFISTPETGEWDNPPVDKIVEINTGDTQTLIFNCPGSTQMSFRITIANEFDGSFSECWISDLYMVK